MSSQSPRSCQFGFRGSAFAVVTFRRLFCAVHLSNCQRANFIFYFLNQFLSKNLENILLLKCKAFLPRSLFLNLETRISLPFNTENRSCCVVTAWQMTPVYPAPLLYLLQNLLCVVNSSVIS